MPLTSDQLDNWFTYHAPTEETAPKYAAIRAAEAACLKVIEEAWSGPTTDRTAHDRVNAVMRAFAEVIDKYAPDSADKTAAIRCVRIARNAANEELVLIQSSGGSGGNPAVERQVNDNLRAARWQANSAIACGGK